MGVARRLLTLDTVDSGNRVSNRRAPTPGKPAFASGENVDGSDYLMLFHEFKIRRQQGIERAPLNAERRPLECLAEEIETRQQRAGPEQFGHANGVVLPSVARQSAQERALINPARFKRRLVGKKIGLFNHAGVFAQLLARRCNGAWREIDSPDCPVFLGKT